MDLVHEEAHHAVPNPREAVLECIQARCIDCSLIQQVPSVDTRLENCDIAGDPSFHKFQKVTPSTLILTKDFFL